LRDIGAELFKTHKTRTFRENWDEGDTYANVNVFIIVTPLPVRNTVTDGLRSHRGGKTVFVAQMKI
jgi:hypothetical protein